ncbi:MAG: tetratricopeptide repeat protein, partial [Acetobacteraceae bacterium]
MNTPPAELYEQALEALHGTDSELAHTLATALCVADPEEYEHQQMAGIAALASNRAATALEHFRRAVGLVSHPNGMAAAWSGMGQAHLLEGQLSEAEGTFRRALSLVHEFPPALFGLAEALERAGRFDEAEQAGRRALELGIQDPRLHVVLG